MDSEIVVGIDFGTTNSCVALYKTKNGLQILPNKEGGRLTPSFVFYYPKNNQFAVGKLAKKYSDIAPEYGISEIKRLLGKTYESLVPYLKYIPFEVKNQDNKCSIIITQNQESTPEDIAAVIFRKIKADLEDQFNIEIHKAVITVPAYFNVTQREAVLEAANKAGFTVLKLLNEPTAAALTYYYNDIMDEEEDDVNNKNEDGEMYSLVYDLGGGTFDVAILQKRHNDIKIVAVSGDTDLGGSDFDNRILVYVLNYLKETYNYDPKHNRRDMRRLKTACEAAKKELSFHPEANIILFAFLPDSAATVQISITRNKFEELIADYLDKTISITDRCLKSANIDKAKIKDVILSGGSTRVPKIRNLLSTYFDGKPLKKINDVDECVANGAALQAALLSCNKHQQIDVIKIADVVSLSLGIKIICGKMDFFIKSNDEIPKTVSKNYTTTYKNQTNMVFDIYEGERLIAEKNKLLGTLNIDSLTPARPGKIQVNLTMSVDQNGILRVEAEENGTDNKNDLQVIYIRGARNDGEIDSCLKNASKNLEEDEEFIRFANKQEDLITFLQKIIRDIENNNLLSQYVFERLYDECKEKTGFVRNLKLHQESQMDDIKKKIENKLKINKYLNMIERISR